MEETQIPHLLSMQNLIIAAATALIVVVTLLMVRCVRWFWRLDRWK
jgi:hypothetical protein